MLFTYDWHETDLDQMLNFALSRNSRLNGENLESNRSVGQNAQARNKLSEQCSDYTEEAQVLPRLLNLLTRKCDSETAAVS